MDFPLWVIKLARRIVALKPGRYQIILTIDGIGGDCTVIPLGKVEKLG